MQRKGLYNSSVALNTKAEHIVAMSTTHLAAMYTQFGGTTASRLLVRVDVPATPRIKCVIAPRLTALLVQCRTMLHLLMMLDIAVLLCVTIAVLL